MSVMVRSSFGIVFLYALFCLSSSCDGGVEGECESRLVTDAIDGLPEWLNSGAGISSASPAGFGRPSWPIAKPKFDVW
jgi:hypothetical protein